MKKYIAILGAGNIGTALAYYLAHEGNKIRMYCIEPDVETDVNQNHRNSVYLPDFKLPAAIKASSDIAWCLQDSMVIIMAVPSFAAAEVLLRAKPYMHAKAIVTSITKGFNMDTLEPNILSQQKLLPAYQAKRLCMLGGPVIAGELAYGSPTAFVVACRDAQARAIVVKLLTDTVVKAVPSADLMGVGLASAVKNAYAIAFGMCDGLKYPTNAKAFVMTLAMQEMASLIGKAGANPQTAYSLAGLGDILVTGWSPHGRNRHYGERLVGARSSKPSDLGLKTVEGIAAAAAGLRLADRLHVSVPLLKSVNQCLRAKSKFHEPFVHYLTHLKFT